MSMNTPWGRAQHQQTIAPGITIVSTAGHGGIRLADERNAQVHEAWRNPDGWYEEDCEANIVGVTFPTEFAAHGFTPESAHQGAKTWYPDQYETVFAVTVTAAESYRRAEQEFETAHADDWVVVSAWGDWQEGVPEGWVGVKAYIGGRHNARDDGDDYFLVPKAEYDTRGAHSFVVDPARHIRVSDFTGYRAKDVEQQLVSSYLERKITCDELVDGLAASGCDFA